MGPRPAQGLKIHLLTGDRLDHFRPGDEHVANALGHDDKVGQARGVNRTSCTWPQHHADLGDDTAGLGVAPKKLAVTSQAPDPLLDARAYRVVEADKGRPGSDGQVQDFADLLRLCLRERATNDRKILGGDGDFGPIYPAETHHDGVAGELSFVQFKGAVSMGDVGIDFLKATVIKQAVDPLPRSEFSLGVLSLDSLGTSALAARFPAAEQFSV